MKDKIKPTPIGDVIKSVFHQLETDKDISQEYIEGCWKESAGEAGAKHSKPANLKNRVLTVRVDSSGWMQELSMQKRRILKGLQRTLGKDRISEIQFKIGEF